MATFVLKNEQLFAVGVTVTVYPKANWGTYQLPPSGAPVGSSTTSAVVQADGTATFSGLADSTNYFAYAASPDRYVNFRTAVASAVVRTERKGRLWMPTAIPGVSQASIIDETAPRHDFVATAAVFTGSIMRLNGNLVIPAGVTVSKISFFAVGAAVTPTHQWFALADSLGNVLGLTADDTSTAWGALTWKTLALTVPYTAPTEIAVYAGILVVAGTIPTVPVKSAQNINSELPKIACNQTSTYTVPGDVGATIPLGANAALTYAVIS